MSHVITWRLGRPGKGWLHPDGTVQAWPTNGERPHHADVPHPEGSWRFRVAPDGAVELYGPPEREAEVAVCLREHF